MPDEPDNYSGDDGEMLWETEAREAIERAASEVEHDEIRGVIYLQSGVDHRFNTVTEGFTSAEELRERLTEIGENEWVAYVPFESGEAVFEPDVDSIVEDMMDRHDVEAFFDRVAPPEDGDELAIARELTPPKAGLIIQVDLTEINDELVRYLAKHTRENARPQSPQV